MQDRDTYWDSLKCFLMICVIIGHVFDLGKVHDRVVDSLQYWIYTFHMPLFVFTTGYFTNCQSKRFVKGILNMCCIYVTFQILHIIEERRMPSLWDIVCPTFSLWYIMCCIWWRLMAKVTCRWWQKWKKTSLTISFLLSLCVGFIHQAPIFAFQRTFTFLPFFFCGLLLRDFDTKNIIYKLNTKLCYVVLAMVFCLIYIMDINLFPYLTGRYWYTMMPIPLIYGVLSRMLWYVVAFVMCILVMRVVPDCRTMAKEGSKTLQYYLLHTLLIPVFWHLCNWMGIEHNIYVSFIIAVLCIVIIYKVKDTKVVSRMLKPIQ